MYARDIDTQIFKFMSHFNIFLVWIYQFLFEPISQIFRNIWYHSYEWFKNPLSFTWHIDGQTQYLYKICICTYLHITLGGLKESNWSNKDVLLLNAFSHSYIHVSNYLYAVLLHVRDCKKDKNSMIIYSDAYARLWCENLGQKHMWCKKLRHIRHDKAAFNKYKHNSSIICILNIIKWNMLSLKKWKNPYKISFSINFLSFLVIFV